MRDFIERDGYITCVSLKLGFGHILLLGIQDEAFLFLYDAMKAASTATCGSPHPS